MSNLSDDWGSYYSNCEHCGTKTHASEGECDCTNEHEECQVCSEMVWYYDLTDGVCPECV